LILQQEEAASNRTPAEVPSEILRPTFKQKLPHGLMEDPVFEEEMDDKYP
jgi:hypothetical protein